MFLFLGGAELEDRNPPTQRLVNMAALLPQEPEDICKASTNQSADLRVTAPPTSWLLQLTWALLHDVQGLDGGCSQHGRQRGGETVALTRQALQGGAGRSRWSEQAGRSSLREVKGYTCTWWSMTKERPQQKPPMEAMAFSMLALIRSMWSICPRAGGDVLIIIPTHTHTHTSLSHTCTLMALTSDL